MDEGQPIKITGFVLADEKAVLDFCQNIFKEKAWPLDFMDKSILEAFSQKGDVFLTAKQNGLIVACAGLKKLSDTEALLTRFYVAEFLRGTGLAKMLFDKIVTRARKLKYTFIALDVARDNIRAIRFYEKQGMEAFTPIPHPRWKESVPGEEKYVMYLRKRL